MGIVMGMSDEEVELHDRLNQLQYIVRDLKSANVVLVGDLMMDQYIRGFANNLNSRAPVPVLRETMRESDVGAAAHVARGLKSMGMNSKLFGVVGDDKAGNNILNSLNSEGVDTTGIVSIENRVTTVKTRLLASRESLISGEQLLLRWDVEDDNPVPEEYTNMLIDSAIRSLDGSDVLILSDYGQGVITDTGAPKLIEAAKKAGVQVIADPKLTGLHRSVGADWVLFQKQGLEIMRKRLGVSSGKDAARKLIDTYGWTNLVVLAGENGVTVYDSENTFHAPCKLEDLRQMIGLIDAAAVALAVSISSELDKAGTAHIANAASECILGAERTESFVLNKSDLIDRLGEMAWNLQISKR